MTPNKQHITPVCTHMLILYIYIHTHTHTYTDTTHTHTHTLLKGQCHMFLQLSGFFCRSALLSGAFIALLKVFCKRDMTIQGVHYHDKFPHGLEICGPIWGFLFWV